LCICLTRQFSTMGLEAALRAREQARELLPGVQIEVIDSHSAVGGMGWIALNALRVAQEGKGLAEVMTAAADIQKKINVIVVMDTLEYLAKGGRIGKAANWAGSLLNIKPYTGGI